MQGLAIFLAVVDIILCIALVILVVFQEGNDRGLGILGGGQSDNFYGKEKARSFDSKLKRFTTFLAILFAVISVSLYLILARGF